MGRLNKETKKGKIKTKDILIFKERGREKWRERER